MGINIKFEFHVHANLPSKNAFEDPVSSECHQYSEGMFFSQATQELTLQAKYKSPSTIRNYQTALASFQEYLHRDISLSEISSEVINYERWLKDRHISPNTISCYMRSLRSLACKLMGEEAKSLFKEVYTGAAETAKRALRDTDIVKLRAASLKPGSFQSLARDLFLFSFYALGMPFVDMAFLRKQNISEGFIIYYRHKTGQRICIPVEQCMNDIISRYDRTDNNYVFPLLHSTAPDLAYKEYLQKLNRYNRALKSIAQKAGVAKRLTSYVSRHTWASLAYSSNIDLAVISKAMGHTNPQNTLIYIRQIDDSRLMEASRKVAALLEHKF